MTTDQSSYENHEPFVSIIFLKSQSPSTYGVRSYHCRVATTNRSILDPIYLIVACLTTIICHHFIRLLLNPDHVIPKTLKSTTALLDSCRVRIITVKCFGLGRACDEILRVLSRISFRNSPRGWLVSEHMTSNLVAVGIFHLKRGMYSL